jgi:hypothetical protein
MGDPLELVLNRELPVGRNTPGEVDVGGAYKLRTVEDLVRDLGPDGKGKVFGETAIPAGRYKVTITFSQKFQKRMILINDVPWFTGIRMHGGLNNKNTEGCVIVGLQSLADGSIKPGTSTPAIARLFQTVDKALTDGREVWITIHDAEPVDHAA